MLIARGVEINNNNSNGFNALMLAAMQNDHEFVQILLEAGADASIQGFTGQTAYDLAKFSELKKVVAIFDNFNLNKIAKSSIKLTNNELLATRKKRL